MENVRIEQGEIAGTREDGVFRFLGLPYAAPPVGENRWRAPLPPASWTGVREATSFGNAAVQLAGPPVDLRAEQDEDCLYLNVWTPTIDAGAHQPVMVWIHGGGFLNGAASIEQWDGTNLARNGVTVVSMNYRLGAFGFLNHPEAGSNFGVLDWIAALNWVAANAASFGGDPGNVTIFGQSAGAAAVRSLLSAPSARGLFHRGIMQSAGFEDYAVVEPPSHERSAGATEQLFERLGSQDIDELRQLPANQVREASLALAGITPPPGQVHTPANLVWHPVVDGVVVQAGFPGWAADVPIMLGCTKDESRFFIRPSGLHSNPGLDPAAIYTRETLETMARTLGGNASGEILAHYASSGMSHYEALAELYSSAIWFEPAIATLERFAALGGRSVYTYRFAQISPGARSAETLAFHSSEIPYVFGNVQDAAQYDADDALASSTAQKAWVEFARTGVPKGPDGSPWPKYDESSPQLTLLTTEARPVPMIPRTVSRLIHSLRNGMPTS